MNVKYRAKHYISVNLPHEVFGISSGYEVTVLQRNGNRNVLIQFNELTDEPFTEWVDASWFLNNFEGVPI